MSNEVKRYDPINSDGTCGMCIEDADYGAYVEYADYAALEAELARLRAGQEPVALQVVAHTQGNLMKSIGHFTDCRTDEGVTVGLIDTIINSARLLATRNLNHPVIVEAIKDLCGDSDVLRLISPQPSAGVVMPDWLDSYSAMAERLLKAGWKDSGDAQWAGIAEMHNEFARLNGKEVGRG